MKELGDEAAKICGYLEAREMSRGYLRNNVGPSDLRQNL